MNKGKYGYLHIYRRNKLISIIILGALIIAGVILSFVIYGTNKSIIIILPILTALPFSKQLVALILVRHFKALSSEEEASLIQALEDAAGNLLFDISVSRYEGIRFFPVVFVKNGRIILYYNQSSGKRAGLTDLKSEMMSVLGNDKNPYIIIVTDNLTDFINKAKNIKDANKEYQVKDKKMMERILELGV